MPQAPEKDSTTNDDEKVEPSASLADAKRAIEEAIIFQANKLKVEQKCLAIGEAAAAAVLRLAAARVDLEGCL